MRRTDLASSRALGPAVRRRTRARAVLTLAVLPLAAACSDRAASPGPDLELEADATSDEARRRWGRDASAPSDAARPADAAPPSDGPSGDGAAEVGPPAPGVVRAASCAFGDVSRAVAAAAAGDTVSVPAGRCAWGGTLTIRDRTVQLVGAGAGLTTIEGGGLLLSFDPAAAGLGLRVAGFTFDLKGGQGIQLRNNGHVPVHSAIRIDHNRFTNSARPGAAIEAWSVRGAIDSNTFDHLRYPLRVGWGTGGGTWDWDHNPDLVWGTPNDNLYVEDNVFTEVELALSDQDEGGRYAFRYNTVSGSAGYPWLDIHGGRGSLRGGMGAEVYGNRIDGEGFLPSQRGGRVTTHHNVLTRGGTINLYDNDGCPLSARERINGSYHFINRRGESGALLGWSSSGGDNCGGVVVQNRTFWVDEPACIAPGACQALVAGVGCGPLAGRPTSCVPGTAYWATAQSCKDLTGMVGARPAAPVTGTLYRCSAPDIWTAHYTPLSYPHPLRGELGGP